ncbi:UNVERIFIED_CONTAM: hypothetical protein GTU68_019330 [Idotea baltica]|nr:hypothetical protein [Idotea baltica]
MLLKMLRAMPIYTPVIIVTARDKISERIAGLNMGADDYIIKPYDLSELSARIETVSRRPRENASQLVQIGDMEFDLARHQVSKPGETIVLTAREWSIMECLLRRPNTVVSRSRLEEIAYSLDTEIDSNAIEAHISRLRTKLGKSAIVTHRGLGYSLAQ